MKKLIIPNSIEQISLTLKYADAYLIGIKGLCVNVNWEVDIDELSDIKQIIKDKELFIALNKNMTNNDIDILNKVLIELNGYNIKGVFYADTCIVSLFNKQSLNYDLVWSNEHATTNYNTINYWYDFNVKYTYISADITLNEIIDIKKNTNSKLIVPIFGYLPMFVSKRHIVKNYLEYFNLKDNSKINYIEKENSIYPIIDNNIGTIVYSNNVLNGLDYYEILKNNNIEYVTFNAFNISNEDFIRVLKVYNNESNEKISDILTNIDDGFLNKETISRVKRW